MKYDFTSILDRRGKDAIAVELVGAPGAPYPAPREGFDVIPMWVADMNFPVVKAVKALPPAVPPRCTPTVCSRVWIYITKVNRQILPTVRQMQNRSMKSGRFL